MGTMVSVVPAQPPRRRITLGLGIAAVLCAAIGPLAGPALPPVLSSPRAQPATTPAGQGRALATARAIVLAARYATLATVSADGAPRARVVDPASPEDDFTIWIATNPRSRKVGELARSPRVTLLYFNAGGAEYVNVEGTATLVSNPDEIAEHWREAWTPFYPGGPLGRNVVLLRVVPSRLEIVSPARGFDTDPDTWRPFAIELGR
jgi:general stress protein 26